MITNIVKNLIKDFPTISNSEVFLFCQDEEKREFIITSENREMFLVVQSKRRLSTSAEDWKKKAIADHIYMATQSEGKTFDELSTYIDEIINSNVTIWEL